MDSLIGLPHNIYCLPSEIIIHMLTYLTPYELYKVMISCKKNYGFVAKYSNVFARNFLRTLSHEQGFHAWDLYHKTTFSDEIKSFKQSKARLFTKLLVVYNYASKEHFNEKYDNIDSILFEHNLLYMINNPPVSAYQCKIRYGMVRLLINHNLIKEYMVIFLCKYIKDDVFPVLFAILYTHNTIINDTADLMSVIATIDYFNNITQQDAETVFKIINKVVAVGGNAFRIFMLIIWNRHRTYGMALTCGVKEQHAWLYSISEENVTHDDFLLFKSLVPIIGYTFANHFFLDYSILLEAHPEFVNIAHQLYKNGCENIEKCLLVLRNPTQANIDRALSLRSAKRQKTA
jgi:hypothetical protein